MNQNEHKEMIEFSKKQIDTKDSHIRELERIISNMVNEKNKKNLGRFF